MKNLSTILVMIVIFMMNVTTAQAQMTKTSVNTSEADAYHANANIPAIASKTGNYLDGYPSVIEKVPGTKTPTIGDLKKKTLEGIQNTWSTKGIAQFNETFKAFNYKNFGKRQEWVWTYNYEVKNKEGKILRGVAYHTYTQYIDSFGDWVILPEKRFKIVALK